MDAVRKRSQPRDIATREAFENAIAAVAATGGSTNAVLHLLAMAREAGVPLTIDDFQTDQRAHAAARRPEAGRQVSWRSMSTRPAAWPVIAQAPGGRRLRGWDAMTVTGRTFAEEAADAKETPGQEVIRAAGQADQDDRRPGDSAGQPGAGRLRDQGRRDRAQGSSAARRASSTAKKTPWRRSPAARSKPATWW